LEAVVIHLDHSGGEVVQGDRLEEWEEEEEDPLLAVWEEEDPLLAVWEVIQVWEDTQEWVLDNLKQNGIMVQSQLEQLYHSRDSSVDQKETETEVRFNNMIQELIVMLLFSRTRTKQ
jgi:hypothetical protein